MKAARIFSLLLALVLQLMPLCRVVTTALLPEAAEASIIMRWIAGAAAFLGACHAVSGASTVITSPTTAIGTNGLAFSYRITTGPQVANTYAAAPLPPGLTCSSSSGKITGTPTSSGAWTVLLTASDSGIPSRTLTTNLALTILAGVVSPPSITTQPQSQTVPVGTNVAFTVAAGGTAPLSYQWRFGSTALTGQTNTTLTLSSVTTNQAGQYTAVVSNSGGSVTSAVATLTVIVPAVAPTITTQPQSRTVIAGTNVSFSVAASGTAPFTYQWRFGGSPLSGQTAATLALSNVASNQAGNYSVIVANAGGSATSSVAVLNVLVPPSITTQPQGLSTTEGGNASFSVAAAGTAPFSYQWLFGGGPLGGQTNSTLSLTGVTTNSSGNYSVVVANSAGSITSAVAVLSVTTAAIPPSITTQPQPQTIFAGASAAFSVVAGGTAPLVYQWNLGGAPLGGQTGSTLNLTAVNTNQAGDYTVVITNIAGSITSAVAHLTVNPAIAPVTTNQPLSQTVFVGANVSFTVGISGTAPLSYQWNYGGGPLPGQTNATLLLNSVTSGQNGNYTVVVSNAGGAATSTVAVLTVNPLPVAPTITTQPQSQSAIVGGSASFSVGASGTAPLSYQWQFHGANLSGQTGATLSLSGLTTNQAGGYAVVVGNSVGSVTSAVAQLTVTIPKLSLQVKDVAGRYNGLLSDTNGVQLGSAGFFTFTLSRLGAYSATLSMSGGWRLSASGKLDAQGHASNKILRTGRSSPVQVDWSVALDGSDQITGTAASASWSAELLGDRAVFNARTNPCPSAGKYTFVLPGSVVDPTMPEGDSFGSVAVDKNGFAALKGKLADGAAITQRVPLSKNGYWPLFVPLYSHTGALISWVTFQDRANDDFNGAVTWMKPSIPLDRYYPAGFSVTANMSGSLYTAPASTSSPLVLTNPVVMFSGGGLTAPITNSVALGSSARALTKGGPEKIDLVFVPATGWFRGSFIPDGGTKAVSFQGAVFQKGNSASGWFPGTKQTGRVALQNSP